MLTVVELEYDRFLVFDSAYRIYYK
jgi:hypothetical protein